MFVNFIHSLKVSLVTRPLPDRYYFISYIWGIYGGLK